MALPGTPVLMYGDEIGMGEDLSLPGRLAVRSPMQWSSRPAGGFSASATPYRPARAGGPYGYRAVNVLDQRHDPDSLYSWLAHAIQVRRQCPEFGWGEWRTLKVSDPRVLAIETRWRDGCVVTLHNLSAEPATVRLPGDVGDRARAGEIRQLLGDTRSPASDAAAASPGVRADADITLAGYGFRWLRLPEDGALG
jgi:maltose alpha-D-glucosyltransferase/alpha-amylase